MPTLAISALLLLAVLGLVWLRTGTRYYTPLLAGVAIAALLHGVGYGALTDDAYITFRYAENWVEGHGVVFNPGEIVEGYSNFLLLVLLTLGHGLFGVELLELARGIGALGCLATVVCAAGCARAASGGERGAGVAAAFLVAGTSSLAAYVWSGLETSMFTALVVAAVWAGLRARFALAGVVGGLATMTHPDGVVVWLALLIGAFALRAARGRASLRVVVGYAACVVPWTLWRLAYYGYLIPNQIEAKRGMELAYQLELGVKYVIRGSIAHGAGALLVAALVCLLLSRWRGAVRRLQPSDVLLGAAVAGYFMFPIAVGGDWMPAYRFLVTAASLSAVFAVRVWQLASEPHAAPVFDATPAPKWIVLIVSLASLAQGFVAPPFAHDQVADQAAIVDGEVAIGRWLGRTLPSDTLTAAWANGAIPFHSRLPTIDLLGLTDEHIARRGLRQRRGHPGHIAYDTEYVIRRAPAIITYLGQSGLQPHAVDDRLAPFRADYDAVSFEFTDRAPQARRFANLWIRRSERERLVPRLVDPAHGIVLAPLE